MPTMRYREALNEALREEMQEDESGEQAEGDEGAESDEEAEGGKEASGEGEPGADDAEERGGAG